MRVKQEDSRFHGNDKGGRRNDKGRHGNDKGRHGNDNKNNFMIKTLSHIWTNITRPYRRKLHRIIDDNAKLSQHITLCEKIAYLPLIHHHVRLFNILLEGRAQHAHEHGYWQLSLQYWQYSERLRALLRRKKP